MRCAWISFLGTQPCSLIYELSAWLPLSRGRLEPLQQTLVHSLKGLHLALYGRSLPTPRLDHLRVSFQNKALTFFKDKTNSITEFMEA